MVVGVELVAGADGRANRPPRRNRPRAPPPVQMSRTTMRGLRVLALEPHEMAGERHVEEDHDARPVRDELAPVPAFGRGERRRDDLEILGAVGVRQDDEVAAVVLDRIEHARVARGDEAGRGARVLAVEQPDLRGLVIADRQHDEERRRW